MATSKTAASKSSRKQALSLHLGLNGVSAAAYAGWAGPLAACEFDANDMSKIAKSQGMKPTVLLTKKATRAARLAKAQNQDSNRADIASQLPVDEQALPGVHYIEPQRESAVEELHQSHDLIRQIRGGK